MSGDTWQAMCHNAWQRHACVPCVIMHGKGMHVCDTWHVNMHGSFEAYIRGFTWAVCRSKESSTSVHGSNKEKEEGKRERKERKGEREEKKRKGRKKREGKKREERERKEEKEGVSRSEQTRTAKNPELCYKR